MTLLNYGNTSSSSVWCELEHAQEHQKINQLKKGHRIMKFDFGSGFKCTSPVWLQLQFMFIYLIQKKERNICT